MKAFALLLTTAVGLAALAGCDRGPYRAEPIDSLVQKSERVVLLDEKLHNRIMLVREAPPKRLPGGQVEAGVMLFNASDKPVQTDVQVIFYDENGIEADSTSWKPVYFDKRAEVSVKENSLESEVADYRVRVRLQR